MKNDIKKGPGSRWNLSFPEDEESHSWLPMLLEAYSITDDGVAEAIRREEDKGKKLACSKGCAACCRTHVTFPVYPLELVGISWYVTEKVKPPQRKKLKEQLRAFKESNSCPFLVDGLCSTYPLRPMACRQFNVFDQPCAEGEDAAHTRRQDVMTPLKEYIDRAFNTMLPFYGAKTRAQRRQVIKSEAIHSMARTMLSHNWATLAEKMEEYEKEHPEVFVAKKK